MEGETIALVGGYPDADTIDNALSDYSGYTPSVTGSVATFTSDSLASCTVTYTEAVAPAAPAVAVAGC
jgi:hypothetical protein